MYFKSVCRHCPETGRQEGYYRLVESYRNLDNRVCHRTLINIGFCKLHPERLSKWGCLNLWHDEADNFRG